MDWVTRLFDKTGSIGAIIAAMGCASCFPLLGSLAALLGLGFLSRFEGLFINTLLPVFAWIVMVAVATWDIVSPPTRQSSSSEQAIS